MYMVLGLATFVVLITLFDTHCEQQRTQRKLRSGGQ